MKHVFPRLSRPAPTILPVQWIATKYRTAESTIEVCAAVSLSVSSEVPANNTIVDRSLLLRMRIIRRPQTRDVWGRLDTFLSLAVFTKRERRLQRRRENDREYRRRRVAMENERKGTRTPGAAWQRGSDHHEEVPEKFLPCRHVHVAIDNYITYGNVVYIIYDVFPRSNVLYIRYVDSQIIRAYLCL